MIREKEKEEKSCKPGFFLQSFVFSRRVRSINIIMNHHHLRSWTPACPGNWAELGGKGDSPELEALDSPERGICELN